MRLDSAGKYHIKSTAYFNSLLLLAIFFLASCSQTKFVAEDDYLLHRVHLEVDNPEISKEEAKSYLRQKENYKILGFAKFYLFLYNLSSKKKTDDWLKRIGEAPQLYDEILTERSVDQLRQFMDLHGYYEANISSDIEVNEKKRKAELTFQIESRDQYKIKRVRRYFANSELQEIFYEDTTRLTLRPGMPFDITELEKQQERIVNLYRNHGYFYFSNNQVKYKADTTLYNKEVVLDLYIGEVGANQTVTDSTKILSPYYIKDFHYSIMPGNTPVTATRENSQPFSDTLEWGNSHLYLSEMVKYPPSLFDRTNRMRSGDLYNLSEVENTFNGFNRLRQFRFVDIQFEEISNDQDSNLLNCNVRLAPLNKQSTSFDIEGTNTEGNLGIAGNIYYQHRNLFKGAEVFQVRLRGATERLSRINEEEQVQSFNTREFGVESNLLIPKLLGPGRFIRSFERYLPKTVFNIGYNYQLRPEYTRYITNLTFGYDWKSTQYIQNLWNLLDLNLVRLSDFDPGFINSIEDLYIKSSFTDHFIMAMNYSIIYNNQQLNSRKNYTYLRFNAESAGNLLWTIAEASGMSKDELTDTITGDVYQFYKVLNTPFAQYLKADIEVRRGIIIDKYNWVVGRAFLGVGVPYGNAKVMPFEKQYFSGGANGIRAWQVRSLGPGTYKPKPKPGEAAPYPNQSADIKIEANVEYRFKLFGGLEGAFFLDAGNIWAINKNDNREGALFKFNKFYKQIAVGTGTGLRYDLNYFILRTDLGLKLRDPSNSSGEKWIIFNRGLTSDDFAFSFAIGYPF